MCQLTMHLKDDCVEISLEQPKATWFLNQIEVLSIFNKEQRTMAQLKADFEIDFDDFEIFWYSKPIMTLKDTGILIM